MNRTKLSIFSGQVLKKAILSGLLEFGPVIVFLVSSKYVHVYESTVILMIGTIISTVVTYQVQRRIPYLALYVAAITLVFGYMTLHFHKVKFIQMRDTLYDLTCALTLIVGLMINVPFLKLAFNKIVPMVDNAWNKLTYLWIGYFILIAVSNEVVRRLFTLHEWFAFKSWILIITSVFGLVALYYCYEASDEHK